MATGTRAARSIGATAEQWDALPFLMRSIIEAELFQDTYGAGAAHLAAVAASLRADAEVHQFIQARQLGRLPDFVMHGEWYYHGEPIRAPYLTLTDIRRIVERRAAKAINFAPFYGGS